MTTPDQTATQLLHRLGQGDEAAGSRLMDVVYDDLRAMAGRMMRSERRDHTLQPTALVHEAYLRLIDQKDADWKGRAHFLAVASEIIRRILIDHARKRKAAKRGGQWHRITLDVGAAMDSKRELDLLALDEALGRLLQRHERQARVVEMRFFGGLTEPEIAEVLGVSRTTVADDWAVARAWLSRELSEDRVP